MHKVAIITRTKDRPLFLERALKSIEQQTYEDYVLVVVNDGGDKHILEEQINQLSDDFRAKIKVFHRDVSSGAPDTIFNESINRVESEYITIHDSDDTWHPEFLERVVASLDGGLDGVVVRCDKVIEATGKSGAIRRLKVKPYLPDMVEVSLYRQFIDNQLTPIAFAYRRSVYNEIGGYDDTLAVTGDWEFGIRFLLRTDVKYINPGFALAFYHHRKTKSDNSFSNHSHRKHVTIVANKYLRKDIESGRFGPGYIISDLKYRQDTRHDIIKKIIPRRIIRALKRRS